MSAATLTPTPPAVPTLAGLDRGDLAERLFDEIVAEAGDLALAYAANDHAKAAEHRGRLEGLRSEATGAMCGGEMRYRRR